MPLTYFHYQKANRPNYQEILKKLSKKKSKFATFFTLSTVFQLFILKTQHKPYDFLKIDIKTFLLRYIDLKLIENSRREIFFTPTVRQCNCYLECCHIYQDVYFAPNFLKSRRRTHQSQILGKNNACKISGKNFDVSLRQFCIEVHELRYMAKSCLYNTRKKKKGKR